jgi:hypothetical protein
MGEPMAKNDVVKIVKQDKTTKCYTYEVRMIIQVISDEDDKGAQTKLDKEGGYVTSREVTLMDAVTLYSGAGKE